MRIKGECFDVVFDDLCYWPLNSSPLSDSRHMPLALSALCLTHQGVKVNGQTCWQVLY